MLSASDRQIASGSMLLSSLPEDLAAHVLERATVQSFRRGETIFLQGDPAESVFVVLSGWVKLFRISPSGAEAVVTVLTRGSSFAEAVALRGQSYPVTAEAVTDVRLLSIRARLLIEMMKARPELCVAVLSTTFQHLHDLVAQVEHLKAYTGAQRVAEFLLELAPVSEGPCTVTLPYDKTLIAGRLGMKPESLSRAFARLREIGVRVQQHHAAIADVGRLREYVEEDRATAWSRAQ